MKMVILAAGVGKRLRPLTYDKPKCMVEYQGKAIIKYILEAAKFCNIKDIAVVSGYKKDVLQKFLENEKMKIKYFINEYFEQTNMVYTLFCAKDFMDDDLIISYADIVYKKEVLNKLIENKDDFSVVVDRKWKDLWTKRMENPLDDAETLKIRNGKIIEIGKKPKSYNDIEGQYIGLIKISKNILPRVIEFYENLDKSKIFDGKDFNNMYMTSFIQLIIDNLMDVKPVFIDGGWVEIDSVKDLKINLEL